eukprot:5101595-Amphidinium_carterae.2
MALISTKIRSSRRAGTNYMPEHWTPEQKVSGERFLATRPRNPFFLQWRDLVREVLHKRVDTEGLLAHPLYEGAELLPIVVRICSWGGHNAHARFALGRH